MSDSEHEPKSGFLKRGKRQLTDSSQSDKEDQESLGANQLKHARTLENVESAELTQHVLSNESDSPGRKPGILRKRKQSSNHSFNNDEFFNDRDEEASLSEL